VCGVRYVGMQLCDNCHLVLMGDPSGSVRERGREGEREGGERVSVRGIARGERREIARNGKSA